ncbi:MAG TPA: Crp/Fnr family transcriptional regulator [Blastocatellia bacterium]|nr:Crp/Fnr family transcriptional regulator [Blastocatellia bacterium]
MRGDNQIIRGRRSRTPLTNRLLAVLPPLESSELLARAEPVELMPGQVLSEPFEAITHVYFPLDALISLLAVTSDGSVVEIGMIGNEGLAGAAALLGKSSLPYRTMVHGPGRALRTDLLTLEALAAQHVRVQRLILRYLHALLAQLAQTAVCNRFHSTGQRLAYLLLASQDRLSSATFPWSRDFLAHLLGADRASVNLTVTQMKKAGLIRQARGQITILDREGLLQTSCECYGIIRAEFDQLFASTLMIPT